jgi:hypothetical protein
MHNSMLNECIKKRNLAISSTTAVLIATTLAVSFILIKTTDNALQASDHVSQAAAVSNSCLNLY